MITTRTASPFQDIKGKVIFEGDYCRSWQEDRTIEKGGGYWIYERVKLVRGVFYLFDCHFDYSKGTDKPHLLIEHYHELEIIDKKDIPATG